MAEDGTIESIEIDISSDANACVRSLNKLVGALSSLDGQVGASASKMTVFATALRNVKNVVNGINASALSSIGNVKVSSTLGKNLQSLSAAVASMDVSKAQAVSTALAPLGTVKLNKSTVDNLARIPEVLAQYDKFDFGSFASQIGQVNAQLAPMTETIERLAAAYSKLPKSMRTAGLSSRSVASSNKYLKDSNTALIASNAKVALSFDDLKSKISGVIGVAGKLSAAYALGKRLFDATIGNVNSYIESMNLFAASMGEYADQASEFAQKVQDLMGIDMGAWSRQQGYFQTLITGMGAATDKASVMSQQLTQLGYDIASFQNIDVETAMLKIQSGIAGELEPLRRIGYDLSNSRMQLEATNLGIEKSIQDMTQAEKVQLRYYMIMKQVTQQHGDMARTIESPANQLRVLQAQVTLAARSIGNLLLPVLGAILPYCIAAAKAVRFLADSIAAALGIENMNMTFDYSDLDTSGMSGVTDEYEDAADAASKATKKAKEYQNTVMGFDELNKLNATPEDTSGSGSGSGASASGGGFDIPISTYDFLGALDSNISAFTDGVGAKMQELAHNIVRYLTPAVQIFERLRLLVAKSKIGYELIKAFDAFSGSSTLGRLGKFASSVEKIASRIAKVFSPLVKLFEPFAPIIAKVGGAFAKLLGPIGVLFTIVDTFISMGSIFHSIETGAPIATDALMGIVTTIGVIGLAFAGMVGWPALVVAAVVAAAAAIATAVYNNWDGIKDFFGGLPDFFGGILDNAKGAFVGWAKGVQSSAKDAWEGIKNRWSGAKGWMRTSVSEPFKSAFSDAWENIKSGARSAWSSVQSTFGNVASFFYQVFSNAWRNVVSVFSLSGNLFGNIQDALYSAFRWVANSVIGGINNVIAWPFQRINNLIRTLWNIKIAGFRPFSGLWTIGVPQIPYLAEGRYGINAGQMFVARENGPEMVGTMGGHTTVANNAQIVEGIEAGVLSAMVKAMAMGGGSNGGGSSRIEIPLVIGSREIARATWSGIVDLERRGEIKPLFA